MKKITLILLIVLPSLMFAQSSRDINTVIQKTIDLGALKKYYSDIEKSGDVPLIIINDDKIPNNLIVFKFNKRVKIMTPEELQTFKKISEKNLDSYFVFEIIEFKDNAVTIKAKFRKTDQIVINVSMLKEGNSWIVKESNAG